MPDTQRLTAAEGTVVGFVPTTPNGDSGPSDGSGQVPGGGGNPGSGEESDEQLLLGFLKGNKANFEKLVHRYERELFHFLYRFLGDRAAAEDTFQETFLQVYESAKTFDEHRKFRPWVFTIAANKARDLLRSQARRYTSPLEAAFDTTNPDGGQFIDLMKSTVPMPGEDLERVEIQKLVQQTVADLPDNLREVIILAYFHQFSYRTIAEMLELPLGTVKSRLHAAVATFADRWRQISQNQRRA